MKNQYGLSRNISQKKQQLVRQKCGFGCVICGSAIIQYHHFDPPFKDCKTHNVEGITLLCGGCHDQVNRGFLPFEAVKNANRNPKALQEKFCCGSFYLSEELPPKIILGDNIIYNFQDIIIVRNKKILSLDKPKKQGEPFLISGFFYDEKNNKILEIRENIWKGDATCWDITAMHGEINIKARDAPESSIRINVQNQTNAIIFSEMNLSYQGHRFLIKDKEFIYVAPTGGRFLMKGSNAISNEMPSSYAIKIFNNGENKFFGTG